MADKEPRRRKKRKDSQKKDDIRSDDSVLSKSESRDSDQDAEEEIIVPVHHQPSYFAKIIFVILFSGLVISMSFIFISLQGAERGSVDIFDAGHEEIYEELVPDHHEEESPESFHENLEDLLPDISNIISVNNGQINEAKDSDSSLNYLKIDEILEEKEFSGGLSQDHRDEKEEYESAEDQGIIKEYFETSAEALNSGEFFQEEVLPLESYSASSDHSMPHPEEVDHPPKHKDHSSDSSESDEQLETTPDNEDFFTTSEVFDSTVVDEVIPTSESFVQNDFEEETAESLAEDTDLLYENSDITNADDFTIRDVLDDIDKYVEKSPEKALKKSEDLLHLHPRSPRLHYIKAQALDKLAEIQRSNKYLEDSIAEYQKIMTLKGVPEKLYLLAGKRAAERLQFRGFVGRSLKLLIEMSDKFPSNVDVKNKLAVSYLLVGYNNEAKKVLLDVLKLAPDSGFAKVHLGFILKTVDSNYSEAIKLLREGINSREEGVIDGRFFFQLGDALYRTGEKNEALEVYGDAVKEGLFLSVYQRSLYNVNSLTAKPWWNPFTTPYAPYFKMLEKNWLSIKTEALALIDSKNSGFLPETEGLQDTGDWKQFELFVRGRKIEKNCLKAPKTCALISQMPDAASCKRGQVKFSIIHPNTHIWAHTGPTNCRLRAHLGLVVPEGVSIRVADETRKWEEGKILMFDDSFEHEAWHNGSSFRLVLIVDFWHPELTPHQKKTLSPI